MTPQERLGTVLCDDIFDAYWEATARLSTTDLVMICVALYGCDDENLNTRTEPWPVMPPIEEPAETPA